MHRWLVLSLGLGLWLNPAWSATFEAQVDRHQLSIEEKLTLTLKLRDSDTRLRAEGVNPNVDLSVLGQDFDIGVPRADVRYNIYQGRGRSTSELRVELFPKRPGTTVIPAFTVDDISTAPIGIAIKALPPDAVPEVFVRSGASADTVWAGQQLVVYLDVFHRVEFADASIGDVLNTEPTRIELMPHWQLPQDSYTTEYKGFRYTVERLAWALFPDQAGALTVHLPSTVVTTTTGRQQRLAHQSHTVTVKALPEHLPNTLIVGRPEVDQTQPPLTLEQHQLTPWTVNISAPVAVTSLPDKLPLTGIPDGIKVYADRARRDTVKTAAGITDKASYTFSVMGLKPGSYALPPLRIPYFDPATGQAQLIELAPLAFDVTAAVPPPATANVSTTPPASTKAQTAAFWPAIAAAFASLWLMTLAMWAWFWRTRPAPASAPPPPRQTQRPRPDHHPLQQHLLTALASPTLEAGLHKWISHHPDQPDVAETIRRVQRHCYGQNRDDDTTLSRAVNKAVARINAADFSTQLEPQDTWPKEAFRPAGRTTDAASAPSPPGRSLGGEDHNN